MPLPTFLYFSILLLTCGLTGFLAVFVWRQPVRPGIRLFAGLVASECLLALVELFSMLSAAPTQALFWYKVRFFFTALIPVLWAAFALAYAGHTGWPSRRIWAAVFIIPILTQVVLWSTPLQSLWVLQEVVFTQSGPFWIAEPAARIPGLWFMVHSFYSLALLVTGTGVILSAVWRQWQTFRAQALLLTTGALVVLITALVPIFNLFPQISFNPFIPGIGLSALLYALAIFRFQFLEIMPARTSPHSPIISAWENRSLALFLFIFILMVTGIAATGYFYFLNYEHEFRSQVESQLASISALKVAGLSKWRSERLADAEIIAKNRAFSVLVQHYLDDPADVNVQTELQSWLDAYSANTQYDRVFLLDANGVERMSYPHTSEPLPAHLAENLKAALDSGQINFLDFHLDDPDNTIHLSLLIPILAVQDQHPLALLVLRINPFDYLYPYIRQWPVPSASAETLIVRRDGQDVLFLNPLRFQPDSALNVRIPLTSTRTPAVNAVLGQTGIVEGVDYRNMPVIADVGPIPGSPWFLVSRIDSAEVYGPIQVRLCQTLLFFGVLVVVAGAGLTLVWRHQRLRDYQGRVDALEAQHASEQKYRLLFDEMISGFALHEIICNPAGKPVDYRFLSINPAFERMTGLAAVNLVGRTVLEVMPDTEPAWIERYGEVALTSRPDQFEDYSGALGKYFEVHAFSPEHGKFATIFNDITDRKQAQELLVESEERFRVAVAEAPVPMMIHDEDDHVLHLSKGWAKFSGYTLEDIPTLGDWTELAYGKRSGMEKDYIDDLFNIKETTSNGEWSVTTKTGEKRIWDFYTTPIGKSREGKRILLSLAVDITERKWAEEELRQMNLELESRVASRTHELREAHEQLVRHERLATLGQLAGSVGHELRNPLGVISNAVYFLKMAQSDAPDIVKEYLEIIENETRTSNKLIADLLDFTRIKSLKREAVAVSAMVAQTLERYPLPPGVELALDLPADLPALMADPQHLLQVLGNLVTNACQAMPQGGKITILASAQKETISIAVQDTGAGIAPENISKIFEPLFTTKAKGIGLGLAICKKLIEANSGHIEVHSEIGKGSIFKLVLPVYYQEKP